MKTSWGKFLNLAHYFPYDVKLRLLAHSRRFLANQKARNAIVGAENLLIAVVGVEPAVKFLCLERHRNEAKGSIQSRIDENGPFRLVCMSNR